MSSGFSGNLGQLLPENCAFDQFAEITISSSPNFNIDKVGYAGIDLAHSNFDNVQEMTLSEKINYAKLDYTRKFFRSINFLSNNINIDMDFSHKQTYDLGTISDGANTAHIYIETGTEVNLGPDASIMAIGFDNTGHLSSTFLNTLELNTSEMADLLSKSRMTNMIKSMAVQAEFGNIALEVTFDLLNPTKYTVTLTLYTNDILPDVEKDVDTRFYCKMIADFIITQGYDDTPYNGFDPVLAEDPQCYKRNSFAFTSLATLVDYMPQLALMVVGTVVVGSLLFYAIIEIGRLLAWIIIVV